jgi:hypothetical protein
MEEIMLHRTKFNITKRCFILCLTLFFAYFSVDPAVSWADHRNRNQMTPQEQKKAMEAARKTSRAILQEMVNTVKEQDKAAEEGNLDAVKDAEKVLEKGKEAMDLVKKLHDLAAVGKLTVELAKEILKELKELLKEFKGLLDEIVELLKDIIEAIIEIFETIFEWIKSVFEGSNCSYVTEDDPSLLGEAEFSINTPMESSITILPEIGLSEDPINLEIIGNTGGFTLLTSATEDPNVLALTVLDLESHGESVDLIPGLATGVNVQTLDEDYPSVGFAEVATGAVELELHTQITNDLFPDTNPVLVTSDIVGHFDTATGVLTCSSMESIDFLSPAPVSPAPLTGLANDTSVEIPLQFEYVLGGVGYTSVFVSDNGYLTFGQEENDPSPSTQEFLEGPPRIAGFWTDLNPDLGGNMEILSEADRFIVYYNDLVSQPDGGAAHFSIALTSDGGCTIYQDGVPANNTADPILTGFSLGGNVTTGTEEETDLSEVVCAVSVLDSDLAVYECFDAGEEIHMLSTVRFEVGTDLNDNGIADLYDILGLEFGQPGTSLDENENWIPDECE